MFFKMQVNNGQDSKFYSMALLFNRYSTGERSVATKA